MHQRLGYVSIVIHGLQKKYDIINSTNTDGNIFGFNRVKEITPEMVLNALDVKFNEIEVLIANHKKQLKVKVEKMAEKQPSIANTSTTQLQHHKIGVRSVSSNDAAMLAAAIDHDMDDEQKVLDKIDDFALGVVVDIATKKGKIDTTNTTLTGTNTNKIDRVVSDYVENELKKLEIHYNERKGLQRFLGCCLTFVK